MAFVLSKIHREKLRLARRMAAKRRLARKSLLPRRDAHGRGANASVAARAFLRKALREISQT
jgi:hypothetical protein